MEVVTKGGSGICTHRDSVSGTARGPSLRAPLGYLIDLCANVVRINGFQLRDGRRSWLRGVETFGTKVTHVMVHKATRRSKELASALQRLPKENKLLGTFYEPASVLDPRMLNRKASGIRMTVANLTRATNT